MPEVHYKSNPVDSFTPLGVMPVIECSWESLVFCHRSTSVMLSADYIIRFCMYVKTIVILHLHLWS